MKMVARILLIALFVTVGLAAPLSAANEKIMLLEEDWRLTDILDVNADEGSPIIIDGQNKYTIYEMNTSSPLMNSSGTVKLQNVRVINSGSNPAAGSLAALSKAAASITAIEAPAEGATKLVIPTVPAFTVSIKSSSNEELIALDASINPQTTQQTSNLVFALSGNGGEAYTASIPVTIAARNETEELAHRDGIPVDKDWTVRFSLAVNPNTINANNIYVLDQQNQKVNVTVLAGSNGQSAVVYHPQNAYLPGTYTLYVSNAIKSTTGKSLKSTYKMPFTVVAPVPFSLSHTSFTSGSAITVK